MSEEKSSLVEEVANEAATETKENKNEFNPLAFTEGASIGEVEVPEVDEDGEPVTDENDWNWEKKQEEIEEAEKEEEYEWEVNTQKEEKSDSDLDWGKIAKELGIEGASKAEIQQTLKAMNTEDDSSSDEVSSPEIQTLEKYLDYSNKELVIEELKADGLTDSKIRS